MDRIKEGSILIQETMDENETLISADGTVLCTWKESVSKRLDSKKLKAEKPEIFEEYATESKRRTFLVK
jgi:predicted phage-related endonuclease